MGLQDPGESTLVAVERHREAAQRTLQAADELRAQRVLVGHPGQGRGVLGAEQVLRIILGMCMDLLPHVLLELLQVADLALQSVHRILYLIGQHPQVPGDK